ncbi:helix-turn-helix domain-containing protein [Streptomyces sp. NPDC004609]|uniref:nSTAND1 domain-containing NTPase n=1 Tax=Streptomyces sp. NPDC004609 TaxID=3364704 RepID=UPI003697890E
MAGRPETPVDPEAGPVQRFAHGLRELRAAAGGITYREMARRAHYSVSTLSQAAAGEQLPSMPAALAYVTACGGDPEIWEKRWHEAARAVEEEAVRVVPDEEGADAPYRGLARFEPGDRELFFGRDHLVDDLVRLLSARRFVMLTGASGSGKSSLLRAGLIPRLRQPDSGEVELTCAAVRVLTPGPRPATTHAQALTPHPDSAEAPGAGEAAQPGGSGAGDTVVIVDQFEEIFTLCQDPAERARFIELLLTACEPGSSLRIVAAVRADFYGHCTGYPALVETLREAHLLIGPMTPAELRQAITGPVRARRLIVERELTARIVEEADGQPGALPLMSHALLETWRRRRGRTLTLSAYEAIGGLHGAIADTAEHAYKRLTPAQARHARRILLRLISPGQGTPDTRRSAARAELEATDPRDIAIVLEHLARARLITLDGDIVDVAHEALISAWPRLRGWIGEDREGLGIHRRLTEAADAWAELGRDAGVLYRGTRLAVAREWAGRGGRLGELNAVERDFLEASTALEDAERAAAARRNRQLRWLSAGLAMLLLLVTGVSVVALQQRQRALRAQQTALSRQLASQSLGLADARPGTAMLLSLEAYRAARTPEARGALLSMSARRAYRTELPGHRDAVSEVAFGPGGVLASVSRDQALMLWDAGGRAPLARLTGHSTWLRAVAVSPDGRTLASGGDDGALVLWNAATRTRAATLKGHEGQIRTLGFSPDGGLVASAGNDRKVRLWDIGAGAGSPSPAAPRLVLTGHTGMVWSLGFSPDGKLLATSGVDRTVRLWSTATGRQLAVFTGHSDSVDAVAFSPDGRTLASGSEDSTVRLWDVRRRTGTATLAGHSDEVRTVAFSPDGRTLASSGHDQTVVLWDPVNRTRRAVLTGHDTAVYTIAFHRSTPLLAVAGESGRITLWDTAQVPLTAHTGRVNEVAFSPDGRTLASAGRDKAGGLWDVSRRHLRTMLTGSTGAVRAVAFSPDGRTLAAATGVAQETPVKGGRLPRPVDHPLLLWPAHRPGRPVKLVGHARHLTDVAFSPDGRTLATSSVDKRVVLWDPVRHVRKGEFTTGSSQLGTGVYAIAFSPDSRLIAAANHDGTATVWDVRRRVLLATLTGHTAEVMSVAFSPDGRTLTTAGLDQTVRLWDVDSWGQQAALRTGPAYAVAFSPDGRTLAAATADSAVTLWDLARRTPLATLTGHVGGVRSVAFSPDGRTLASAGDDQTVRLWNTDPVVTKRQLCGALARDLTGDEWRQFLPDVSYHRTCTGRSSAF